MQGLLLKFIFFKAARFVYEEVAVIPKGAAKIIVKDSSHNYLGKFVFLKSMFT